MFSLFNREFNSTALRFTVEEILTGLFADMLIMVL